MSRAARPAEPGPRLPRRGNRVTRALGRAAMRARGWRISGTLPDLAQAVVIVAPHTSNWDFAIGVGAMFALGLRVSWLGKHTLFRWPLGPIMRWLGGVPVRRGEKSGTVAQAIERFRTSRTFVLALAPEGTRRARGRWRLGFLRIAEGARVPVVPVALDWGRHEVRLGPAFEVTGDLAAAEHALRQWYGDTSGRR